MKGGNEDSGCLRLTTSKQHKRVCAETVESVRKNSSSLQTHVVTLKHRSQTAKMFSLLTFLRSLFSPQHQRSVLHKDLFIDLALLDVIFTSEDVWRGLLYSPRVFCISTAGFCKDFSSEVSEQEVDGGQRTIHSVKWRSNTTLTFCCFKEAEFWEAKDVYVVQTETVAWMLLAHTVKNCGCCLLYFCLIWDLLGSQAASSQALKFQKLKKFKSVDVYSINIHFFNL